MIPLFIGWLEKGEAPRIEGDGLQTRDFTYIDNVIRANLLAARESGVGGEVFNVACNDRITILDLAGQSAQTLEDFSIIQKLQQRLTNWQDTGQWKGLDRIVVRLNQPQTIRLRWHQDQLLAFNPRGSLNVLIDPRQAKVVKGPASASRVQMGKRTFLAWAVDTVRNFSWVGPDKIAWLED